MEYPRQQFCGGLGMFFEGLAVAEIGGKWFHILEDGTPAYPQRYEKTEFFQQGTAWAKKNGKWIKIDKQGKEVKMRNTSTVI